MSMVWPTLGSRTAKEQNRSNTLIVSTVAFCTEPLASSLLITKSKLTILANFLVIVSFLDCNFSYYLVLVTNLFGIIVIVKVMSIFLVFVII